jgi:hypothetical protein
LGNGFILMSQRQQLTSVKKRGDKGRSFVAI